MGLNGCWRTFVQSLKTSYEHIGKVMLYNLLWFALGFAPILALTYLPIENGIFAIVCIIATFITLGGATAAVHYTMNRVLDGEEIAIRDFWTGFKRFSLRGFVIVLLGVLGFGILVFNIWFSGSYPSKVFLLLSGFWIWGIVYWYSLLQFVFPFVTQQDIGVFLSLKRAALITLDNPLASAILVVISVIVIALSLVLAAPILIFLASFLALLQNHFYRELMLKYAEAEAESASEEL